MKISLFDKAIYPEDYDITIRSNGKGKTTASITTENLFQVDMNAYDVKRLLFALQAAVDMTKNPTC